MAFAASEASVQIARSTLTRPKCVRNQVKGLVKAQPKLRRNDVVSQDVVGPVDSVLQSENKVAPSDVLRNVDEILEEGHGLRRYRARSGRCTLPHPAPPLLQEARIDVSE